MHAYLTGEQDVLAFWGYQCGYTE